MIILPAVDRKAHKREGQKNFSQAIQGFANKLEEKEAERVENEAFREEGLNLEGKRGKARDIAIQAHYQGKLKKEDTLEKLRGNRSQLRDIEKKEELEEGSLEPYESNPQFALKVHGKKEQKRTQASQPIDPEQKANIAKVKSTPEFQDASPSQKLDMLLMGDVSKENANAVINPYIEEEKIREKKLLREEGSIERSHKAHEPFIKETTQKYRSFETDTKPRLLQMQNIPDEDLTSPTQAVFLEAMGIPLGALENPSSELYSKLSLDLLKGLPETYGNRILKVEVDNFLKTIPSLLNSPEGRRMIASNMLKLGEMKEVFYNEMRRQQKGSLAGNKALPKDFEQEVFDQVKPRIDKINNEFVKMAEVKEVPKGTIPFFNPSGDIEFVPKEHAQWAQENGGKRIW